MGGSPVSEVPGSEQRLIAGRYRLLSRLGRGGMGVVWRGRDEVLGREVAVKEVLAPASLDSPETGRLYARLEREAWAAARISHRNVVTVYDVATEDGRPWIVMELVRGLALSDVLDAEGPMPPQRVARIGAEVLAALRAAHEAGVLHRDVKPANVLLANDGRVVLSDFGIATVAGTQTLTITGEVVGSPEFLAPERALGRTPGPASDLWSLGVLLYAAVEGNSPFRQDTPLSTLRAVVDDALPPPRRAGPLAPVIEGLLRKDPAERWAAEEAEHQLRVVAAGGTVRIPPGGFEATTVAAVPPGPPTPVLPLAAAAAAGSDTAGPQDGGRSRHTGAVLLTAVLVLLLALGWLVYALVKDNNRGSGGSSASAAPAPSVPHSSPTPGASGSAGRESSAPPSSSSASGGSASASPSASSPPAQSVEVNLQVVRGSYRGTCPAPSASAPSMVAVFTVGRAPADVEYRWVTRDGESSDPGWKTLSFPSGGPRTRQVVHTESPARSGSNELHVEVRGPVKASSGPVGYSVTCTEETPTGGASSSHSPPGTSSPAAERNQAAFVKVGR
ncbi:serine/threonine-protein kinase [Streptomyces sp. NPDC001691]|uniref:serine/threonine-protein kinase n=1 Tax=Streptomyces sp. NPDC001691 TaxID=3364600 RepID=UPI0036B2B84A